MNSKHLYTTILVTGFLAFTMNMVHGEDIPARGPVSFSPWDQDSNGMIDRQEFDSMRQQRQKAVKAAGRMGRNMGNAPGFDQIDSDGDNLISPQEMATYQQNRRAGMARGKGQGQGCMRRGGGNFQ